MRNKLFLAVFMAMYGMWFIGAMSSPTYAKQSKNIIVNDTIKTTETIIKENEIKFDLQEKKLEVLDDQLKAFDSLDSLMAK
jgi:hypothetical protein